MVGSRRSRAATFGDETIEQAAGSASRESCSFSPEVQAVSTSSAATVFSDNGEPNGETANAIAAHALGDWGPLLRYMRPVHSFSPAANALGEPMVRREEPGESLEQLPAQVPLTELQRRAGIKFSGTTGAVVSSGGAAATTAPTYGLVDGVIAVVESLRPELFERWAEHRPCGLLDRRSAYGMLICDVHGLPLLPYTLAEPIGKTALKRKGEIAGEQSKAKKKAKRDGVDPEKAATDVLRRPVALNLPTPVEIAAAWRLLAKASAQPPASDPPAADPPAADPPAADQPNADPPDPRRVHALECMFGSQVALDAIDAAYECERHERDLLEAEWDFLDEFDEPIDKEPIKDELQVARVRYAQALRKLNP